jgi:hypothetical protein
MERREKTVQKMQKRHIPQLTHEALPVKTRPREALPLTRVTWQGTPQLQKLPPLTRVAWRGTLLP